MALAGRSPRRSSGGRRILIVALLVTLVVLLVDASIKSRSPAPVRQLAEEAWLDQALPLIRASTVQGDQIDTLVSNGLHLPAGTIASTAKQTASAAASTYREATKLGAPSTISAAAGLLDACLLVREQAAKQVARVMVATLSGPATSAAATSNATSLSSAAQSFQVADKAYQLFTNSLSGLDVHLPSSQWAKDPALYQSPRLTVYLQALRNATNLTPLHHLEVVSLSTDPQAESLDGATQVLPLMSHLSVALVVANVGNQTERNLTVTATIQPAVQDPVAREYVSTLAPGTAQALTVGYLYPPSGTVVTLTVTVTGPTGSTLPPATKSLAFEMPAPNQPISTTTTTIPTPIGTTPPTVPVGATTTVPAPTLPSTTAVPAGASTTTTTPTTVPATTTTTVGGG
jgi:hypothetical protein